MKACMIFFTLAGMNYAVAQIEFQEINIGCLNLPRLGDHHIIQSQAEYEELLNVLSPHPDCQSYVLPSIDFKKKVLIGVKADAGGCKPPDVRLQLVSSGNGCTVNISIEDTGMCKMLNQKRIWIIADKSSCGQVDFNITRYRK